MKRMRRPTTLVSIVGVLVLIGFIAWYRGGQTPLSAEEQARYVTRLQQLTGAAQGFVNLEATREFMRTDDGKPFYVINVFKFRNQADYGDTADPTLTGWSAFNRFSAAVLPIWIKYGAHPVFATAPTERLSEGFVNDWDFVSVVRYRSRRDFVDMQLDNEFAAILPHRIAATEANIRLKLPGAALPAPLVLLIAGWVLVLAMTFLIERRFMTSTSQNNSRKIGGQDDPVVAGDRDRT